MTTDTNMDELALGFSLHRHLVIGSLPHFQLPICEYNKIIQYLGLQALCPPKGGITYLIVETRWLRIVSHVCIYNKNNQKVQRHSYRLIV